MKYKIRHEEAWAYKFALFSVIAFFASTFTTGFFMQIPSAAVRIIGVSVILLSSAAFASGTVIGLLNYYKRRSLTVLPDSICIRYLLKKRTIQISDILSMQIERYSRKLRRKGIMSRGSAGSGYFLTEQRLRLKLSLLSGETVELTDSATAIHVSPIFASMLSTHSYLQDEEVPLFMAYSMIQVYQNTAR